MRSILALAGKDLLQTRRDKLAALFTFILPIVFTMFFGFLFGGAGPDTLPVALLDLDGGAAAQSLTRSLEDGGTVSFETYTADQAKDLEGAVQRDRVAAAIIIPAGFTAGLTAGDGQAAGSGETERKPVTVVGTVGSTGAQSVLQSVQTALNQVLGARAAAGTAITALGQVTPAGENEWNQALGIAEATYAAPAATVSVQTAGTEAGQTPRGFDLSSPGMLVNWILFSLLTSAIALVQERKTGALRRLLTTRVRSSQVIFGKALAMLALTMIQQVVLISLGQFVFGVDYLRDPAALVLTMITLSLLAASLGLMIASLLKSEQAVIATTVILSMVLASMGGAWFPLEITGPTFSAIGHMTPAAWALNAFQGIILQGWGVAEVLPSLAAAWAYAAVFFAVAVWRFRFE